MQLLVLLLGLHVVVVGALVVGRALHAKLGALAVPTVERPMGESHPTGRASAPTTGRNLEDYVQAGLMDLRIMLVQAARRRDQ